MEKRSIGPIFINGPFHLQLLLNAVTPTIIAALENDRAHYDVILQQDGALSHLHSPVKEH